MIYVATMQGGKFVKIGFTADDTTRRRFASMQTATPFQIDELFTVAGSLRQEQAIHAALKVAFHRIRVPIPGNEWYPGRLPFMQKFLDALRLGPVSAMAVADAYNPSVRQFGTSRRFDRKNAQRIDQERSSG